METKQPNERAWHFMVPICLIVAFVAYYLTTMPIGQALLILASLTTIYVCTMHGEQLLELAWCKSTAQHTVRQIEDHLRRNDPTES